MGHIAHIDKAKGDHLDRVHSDQMVPEMIRWGRMVLVISGKESQNCGGQNSRATFSDDAQIRIGKQL